MYFLLRILKLILDYNRITILNHIPTVSFQYDARYQINKKEDNINRERSLVVYDDIKECSDIKSLSMLLVLKNLTFDGRYLYSER